jgi:hypothetical protein
MTPEQWFWVVLMTLNAFTISVRVSLMMRDGASKVDYVMLAGGALVIGYGAWILWSTS